MGLALTLGPNNSTYDDNIHTDGNCFDYFLEPGNSLTNISVENST